MINETIIRRIQKLLALATSPNEHEAAEAAAKAQALMQEYDLSAESISVKVDPRTGGITETDRIILRAAGKPGGWKVRLFETVAQTSDCWITLSSYHWDGSHYIKGDSAQLIGRPRDIEMAHYLFDYLTRELERLQKVYGDERWAELRDWARTYGHTTHYAETVFKQNGHHPLRSKDSWIKGATLSVMEGLARAKYERDHATDAGMGLVVSKEGEKEAFVQWQRDVANAEISGLTVEQYREQREARRAAFRSQAPVPVKETPVPTKREVARQTAEDRRAQAASEAYWRREAKKEETARRREMAKLDVTAYRRGRADGAEIAPRPGITPAQEQARRVGTGQR